MKYTTLRFLLFLLGLSLLILAGCARTLPAQFYVLSPMAGTVLKESIRRDITGFTLEIGPVEIPEYLDRPQIVTRANEHELRLAEFNKWAEPLQENISRVLTENLTNLLHTDSFIVRPWRGSQSIDYRLTLNVIGFEGSLTDTVSLSARWNIYGTGGKKLLLRKKSSYTEPVASPDYEALISAQSAALAALCRDIAGEIRAISGNTAGQ